MKTKDQITAMENTPKKDYWVSVEDITNDPRLLEQQQQEFPERSLIEQITASESDQSMIHLEATRRDFLKLMGFSLGAATLAAACEIPVRKAIPYVVRPDTIVPGVPVYYATSYVDGGDYCSILVKTREGRPIKIEGNSSSSITRGGTSARVQAHVLSLYDTSRLSGPVKVNKGTTEKISWADLDKAVMNSLAGKKCLILTSTILSPSAKKAIGEFINKYPGSRHVIYDANSSSALLDANLANFGKRVVPTYHFEKANYILSFNADFLGTWISPVQYAGDYAKNRKINKVEGATMSRHVQVESHMSLTGSNADHRVLVKPSEQGAAILHVYNELAKLAGGGTIAGPSLSGKSAKALTQIAQQMWAMKGQSLIVSGSNNKSEQMLVNKINHLLGNYGSTIDIQNPSYQRQGSDTDVIQAVSDLQNGAYGGVITWGCNPVYDLPSGLKFSEALSKASISVSCNMALDETGSACQYVAPMHHQLESWGDVEPVAGQYSFIQPVIAPIFSTRQAEHSLLVWSGSALSASDQPYHDYIQSNWKSWNGNYSDSWWQSALHSGVYQKSAALTSVVNYTGDLTSLGSTITQPGSGFEIQLFENIQMGAGQHANNPWLMEMPDPVTRCVWGNHLCVPISWEGGNDYKMFNGLQDGDIVSVDVNGSILDCVVVHQFGQMPGTAAIALGYGRKVVGPAGLKVGTDVRSWTSVQNNNIVYHCSKANISNKVGNDKDFACVQHHHTMGVTGIDPGSKKKINVDELVLPTIGAGYQGSLVDRTILKKANLNELTTFTKELAHQRKEFAELNSKTLYPDRSDIYSNGHYWGMHVDMSACIGCGACTVACMSENNVPVVGKHEVKRHHEMTWIRIDRYYYGELENPSVAYQPMMCQHCKNAPCENVCPVSATNHSKEGINQMAYNRCIGTRYCANNCPFKVRRFNWLDYTKADIFVLNEPTINKEENAFGEDNLTRMVLNPDVTVRSRGVMEKCSFCVQRIQEGKLRAKTDNRKLMDSDIKTACQSACPTDAITFGDQNNKESQLMKNVESPIVFHVLEEVNTGPAIYYSARITNRDETLNA